jgi:hypothetical protein
MLVIERARAIVDVPVVPLSDALNQTISLVRQYPRVMEELVSASSDIIRFMFVPGHARGGHVLDLSSRMSNGRIPFAASIKLSKLLDETADILAIVRTKIVFSQAHRLDCVYQIVDLTLRFPDIVGPILMLHEGYVEKIFGFVYTRMIGHARREQDAAHKLK